MKRHDLPAGSAARARALRLGATDAERRLWLALREGLPEARFRRQVPMGSYIADFVSHATKLIVEVDGSQHGDAIAYDTARTCFLEGEGFRVLRFWNNEVLDNLDGVLTAILAALPELPPRKRVREEPAGFMLNDAVPISLPPCGGEAGEGGAGQSPARAEGAPSADTRDEPLRALAGRSPHPVVPQGEGAIRASAAQALRAPSRRDGAPFPLPSPTRGEGGFVKPSVWS